jgi:hypothetical protein
MRNIILFSALLAVAPVSLVYAQSDSGMKGGAYNAGQAGASASNSAPGPADPSNCGTPDQPKACGPMPRHPLATYPGPRE